MREDAKRFLRELVEPALTAGLKVVVVLEPESLNRRHDNSGADFGEDLGLIVIDAANRVQVAERWADLNHFDARGREAYSAWLIEQLEPLLAVGG